MRNLLALALLAPFVVAAAAQTTTRTPWVLLETGASFTSEAKCLAAAKLRTTPSVCRKEARFTPAVVPPPVTPPPVTWTECAREGAATPGNVCTFQGRREVRYTSALGAATRQIVRVGESPVVCNDGSFGAGFANYENICTVSSVTTTAPITVVPQPVTPPPVTPPPVTPPPASGNAGPRVTTFTPSGPIVATAGQVISGLAISNPNGDCIRVTVPTVTIRDSKIGPCGRHGVLFTGNAAGSVLEHSVINDSGFGAYADNTSGVTIRKNVFNSLRRIGERYAHAVAVQYADNVLVEGNEFLGSFPNDVLSGYQASNIRYLNNLFDISQLDEPTGAAFTIGDSTTGNTGRDNYIAGNIVRRQVGGVPAGVFGSAGNTVLEKNCLTAGIQAYNYSGVFVGVTVRLNVINMANSFVPDPGAVGGWSTNIDGTDCSKVPQ